MSHFSFVVFGFLQLFDIISLLSSFANLEGGQAGVIHLNSGLACFTWFEESPQHTAARGVVRRVSILNTKPLRAPTSTHITFYSTVDYNKDLDTAPFNHPRS